MPMRLGYACINTSLPTTFKTCRLSTYEKKGAEIIKELTIHNLKNVYAALEWNVQHNIYFYRLSSEIVPLGSHEKMIWEWWKDDEVIEWTTKIAVYRKKHHIRLSMHPGQFTVLSTPRDEVLQRTFADLEYHDKLLNLVGGIDMIIHGGGQYGNIESAKQRFIGNYQKLSKSIKNKLRIENDDRTYQLLDVLDISERCHIPVCFDIHHHVCHNNGAPIEPMVKKVFDSWKDVGTPKVHISSGKTHVKDRSHHDYVFESDFSQLQTLLKKINVDADIMIEAKLKERAVLRILKEFSFVPD